MAAVIGMQVIYTLYRKVGISLKLAMLAILLDCIYIYINVVNMAVYFQSQVSKFKTTCLVLQPSFHPYEVDQMKELLWMQTLRVTFLPIVALKPWSRWTLSIKRTHKIFKMYLGQVTTVSAYIYICIDKYRN